MKIKNKPLHVKHILTLPTRGQKCIVLVVQPFKITDFDLGHPVIENVPFESMTSINVMHTLLHMQDWKSFLQFSSSSNPACKSRNSLNAMSSCISERNNKPYPLCNYRSNNWYGKRLKLQISSFFLHTRISTPGWIMMIPAEEKLVGVDYDRIPA